MTPGIFVLILRFSAVALLFAFLGWAVLTIWRDFNQEPSSLAMAPPTLHLSPAGDEQEGIHFTERDLMIGRSMSNTLVLDNPSISSFHAHLSFHHQQWWIEDLNSTNGTYLNQERITTPTVLTTGDVILFGEIKYTVEILTGN
jgi:pSer/pThr/pTyr-binding forkhead associated (FHA) protein